MSSIAMGLRYAVWAMTPPPPRLSFVFEGLADLGPPIEIGRVPHGERRIFPILGGVFEGPFIRGKILNGGADWQIVRADGTAEIDTRYTLQTDAGATIYVRNAGIRTGPPEVLARLRAGETAEPSSYYFRTSPRFETSAPELAWLTRAIFVCSAERMSSQVMLRVWRVE
jgi:hypothetical protein